MRTISRQSVIASGAVILAVVPWASSNAQVAQWCGTSWDVQELVAGECSTQGDCDLPSIRDEHLPYGSTEVKLIRAFFHSFARDDGLFPWENPRARCARASVGITSGELS